MARRGTKGKAGPAPFTKVYTSWPYLLHEAGLSGSEWAVLVALAQHPQRNGLLSRPVADYGAGSVGLATATGMSAAQVNNALSSLCQKTFTAPDGTTKTILTRKASAHRGKVAVYKCNLPRRVKRTSDDDSDHDDLPPTPQKDTEESITNPLSKSDGKHNQSVTSCITNPLDHLEEGKGGQKTHPPLPWLR